jgi:hypothetical protein
MQEVQIHSIYRSEEERIINKPKRKQAENPGLAAEMVKYKMRIEAKF